VIVELGLYAVARMYWTIFAASFAAFTPSLRTAFIVAGALTTLTGAVMCFAQFHLKRMLAFSTISHMELLFVGFGLFTPAGMAGLLVYLAGSAWLDEAARSSGYGWITVVTSLAAIATAGAVLRVAGRIFLGLGPG